jgi:hypothetical protein
MKLKELKAKIKHFTNVLKSRLSQILEPQPEIQVDYVDKVVHLLRRDFSTAKQNEILLSIGQKLSNLREEDMRRIEKEYATLQENTNTLKDKMALV